jgi:hypothetical protein
MSMKKQPTSALAARAMKKIILDFHQRAFGEEAARVHSLPAPERIRYMQRLRRKASAINSH